MTEGNDFLIHRYDALEGVLHIISPCAVENEYWTLLRELSWAPWAYDEGGSQTCLQAGAQPFFQQKVEASANDLTE